MSAPAQPRRIVFACAGNICRSPLALHAFRRAMAARANDGVETASFGLVATDGDVPRAKTIRAAAAAGLDLRGHVARRLHAQLLRPGDLVLVMERTQADAVTAMTSDALRVLTLGSLVPSEDADIADPEDGDDAVFDACVARIVACVEALASSQR